MTHHLLKTAPVQFQGVWTGALTFQVRLNDRLYQAGDTVTLREFDVRTACTCAGQGNRCTLDCDRFSGREITATIGFVMGQMPGRGNQRGFNGGDYVVFSLVDAQNVDGRSKTLCDPLAARRRVASAGSL